MAEGDIDATARRVRSSPSRRRAAERPRSVATAHPAGAEEEASPAIALAQPLAEVLATPILAGAKVLAGAQGLERPVERLNVMEVPDILPWVKPHEFLLTTAYPLRGIPETLPALVRDLDRAGLSGIGIKLGRYLDEIPAGMLEVSDQLGFPIVQLPDDVGFDEILNDVLTGILNRQAQALARSERIHRAFLQLVLRGHGVREIARDLAELIDGAAVIVDDDGRVLASARLDEVALDDGVSRIDHLDVTGGAVQVGDRRLRATAVAIMAGQRAHGHVVALGTEDPASVDLQALENAATVAALALTKELEVKAVEDKYRSDLMHDLLREVEDPDDALRRADGFGWDLRRRLIAVVLRIDDPPEIVLPDELTRRPPLGTSVRQRILERDPGAAVVRFSHEVVVLTAAFEGDGGKEEARRFARTLVADARNGVGGPVSAGLSRPVHDVVDIARAYDQARRALVIGRDVQGSGAVAHFDDLGAYRLLSLVEDRAELRSFVDEILGELADDTDTAEDLRNTLRVLLETGGNVAEAARRLHFHYNTLRYRIDKLEGILGPFTDDARTRLNVQLALLVLEMRSLDERR